MKVGMQTWGSDGDIYPMLALAAGLSKAGHEITLGITSVDSKDYSKFAKEHNFRIIRVAQKFYKSEENFLYKVQQRIINSNNPVKQFKLLIKYAFDPVINQIYQSSLQLCEENDFIIGHFILYPLFLAAEKLNKDFISVFLNPMMFVSKFIPPFGFPNLGVKVNPIMWKLFCQLMKKTMQGQMNQLRLKEKAEPVDDFFLDIFKNKNLKKVLLAASPTILKRQEDWSEKIEICGYFNTLDNKDIVLEKNLHNFLTKGKPPIYMSLGSMISIDSSKEHLKKTTKILVESAQLANTRAIIQSRWEEVDIPTSSDIFKVVNSPHKEVFPKCSLVVHHGGAGTTHTASLSGCPSIIVSYLLDQPFWASRLIDIGISTKVFKRSNITSKKLSNEIRKILDSEKIRSRAKSIGNMIKSENGVEKAVGIINNILKT